METKLKKIQQYLKIKIEKYRKKCQKEDSSDCEEKPCALFFYSGLETAYKDIYKKLTTL